MLRYLKDQLTICCSVYNYFSIIDKINFSKANKELLLTLETMFYKTCFYSLALKVQIFDVPLNLFQ